MTSSMEYQTSRIRLLFPASEMDGSELHNQMFHMKQNYSYDTTGRAIYNEIQNPVTYESNGSAKKEASSNYVNFYDDCDIGCSKCMHILRT